MIIFVVYQIVIKSYYMFLFESYKSIYDAFRTASCFLLKDIATVNRRFVYIFVGRLKWPSSAGVWAITQLYGQKRCVTQDTTFKEGHAGLF